MRTEQLKGRVLQHIIDTILPNVVAEEENAITKEPIVSGEDNIFDQLGNALLEGCANLDLDKVCTYLCRNMHSFNYNKCDLLYVIDITQYVYDIAISYYMRPSLGRVLITKISYECTVI